MNIRPESRFDNEANKVQNFRMKRQVLGVIPARWGSTRFPGKMLHPLCGRPLLAWVVDRVRCARRLDGLLVATDDERIAAAAAPWGVEVVMTAPDHPSGTDRVAEAVRGRDAEGVINIQGDEPMIEPELIDRLAETILGPERWDMATAAAPMDDPERVADPAQVKVVCAGDGSALYFSRAPIPYRRDAAESLPPGPVYWRHIGIYAYRRRFLDRLVREPPCMIERMEKLEQLRALHLGARIHVTPTRHPGPGVDTPTDVARAEAALREVGRVNSVKESPCGPIR